MFTQEKTNSEEEGPLIRENLTAKINPAHKIVVQIGREVHSDPEPTRISIDKGKQKYMEIGSWSKTTKEISHGFSTHETKIERMRREREDLQRELEKVELEVANEEVKRKINYLKAPPTIFPSIDPNKPLP